MPWDNGKSQELNPKPLDQKTMALILSQAAGPIAAFFLPRAMRQTSRLAQKKVDA